MVEAMEDIDSEDHVNTAQVQKASPSGIVQGTAEPAASLRQELESRVNILEAEVQDLEKQIDDTRIKVGELLGQLEEAEAEAAMFASSEEEDDDSASAGNENHIESGGNMSTLKQDLVVQQELQTHLEKRLEEVKSELIATELAWANASEPEPEPESASGSDLTPGPSPAKQVLNEKARLKAASGQHVVWGTDHHWCQRCNNEYEADHSEMLCPICREDGPPEDERCAQRLVWKASGTVVGKWVGGASISLARLTACGPAYDFAGRIHDQVVRPRVGPRDRHGRWHSSHAPDASTAGTRRHNIRPPQHPEDKNILHNFCTRCNEEVCRCHPVSGLTLSVGERIAFEELKTMFPSRPPRELLNCLSVCKWSSEHAAELLDGVRPTAPTLGHGKERPQLGLGAGKAPRPAGAEMEAVLAEARELGLVDQRAVEAMRRRLVLEEYTEEHYIKLWRERCNAERHARLPLHLRVAASAPSDTEADLRLPPGHLAISWNSHALLYACRCLAAAKLLHQNGLILGFEAESDDRMEMAFVRALKIAEHHGELFQPVLYRHYRLEYGSACGPPSIAATTGQLKKGKNTKKKGKIKSRSKKKSEVSTKR